MGSGNMATEGGAAPPTPTSVPHRRGGDGDPPRFAVPLSALRRPADGLRSLPRVPSPCTPGTASASRGAIPLTPTLLCTGTKRPRGKAPGGWEAEKEGRVRWSTEQGAWLYFDAPHAPSPAAPSPATPASVPAEAAPRGGEGNHIDLTGDDDERGPQCTFAADLCRQRSVLLRQKQMELKEVRDQNAKLVAENATLSAGKRGLEEDYQKRFERVEREKFEIAKQLQTLRDEHTSQRLQCGSLMMVPMPTSDSSVVVLLPKDECRFDTISTMFTETCVGHRKQHISTTNHPPPKLIVNSISMIYNPVAADSYRRRLRNIPSVASEDTVIRVLPYLHKFSYVSRPQYDKNEVFAFHGCPPLTLEVRPPRPVIFRGYDMFRLRCVTLLSENRERWIQRELCESWNVGKGHLFQSPRQQIGPVLGTDGIYEGLFDVAHSSCAGNASSIDLSHRL